MNKEALLLDVKHLQKTYKQADTSLDVLKDINLNLRKGEIVALVGQSGSGKSTLLHCLGLLDQSSAGDLMIKGKKMHGKNDKARTDIRRKIMGFVYQFHYLQPEFTALENIAMPLMITGKSKTTSFNEAENLLELVGLSDRADHRPARLSGGEQQRVAIARALANNPEIILADEPTGNLDEKTASHIFDILLKAVKERGVSALIATHNQQLAAKMDRVLTLENGCLGVSFS